MTKPVTQTTNYPDKTYSPIKEFIYAVVCTLVCCICFPAIPFFIYSEIRASQAKRKLIERRCGQRRSVQERRNAVNDRRNNVR